MRTANIIFWNTHLGQTGLPSKTRPPHFYHSIGS